MPYRPKWVRSTVSFSVAVIATALTLTTAAAPGYATADVVTPMSYSNCTDLVCVNIAGDGLYVTQADGWHAQSMKAEWYGFISVEGPGFYRTSITRQFEEGVYASTGYAELHRNVPAGTKICAKANEVNPNTGRTTGVISTICGTVHS